MTALPAGGKGGIGKSRADLPNLLTALTDAELSLESVNKSTGTGKNVALKFIAEAKAEAGAATDGKSEHLPKAQKAIEEALKRVMQAIDRK